MSEQPFKPIFERSFKEVQELLEPIIQKVEQELLDKGLYISYRDQNCTTPDLFMHRYKDGRKEMVSVNVKTGEITLVRGF
ncbi:hypothetical protein BDD43_1199 [Mucilaginibacter gracilis]|uniref:Uncharacterized protein n=1 Tax=Mucilaginibacter gracilis TaxID=423350 RepID=A0A495IWC9_9SPHI|nr:hypothetical protein [Mucilaginibacter gracilis]RKR81056.1 hypothetical protein BDD43_1199 [Mucilaginibacter gracilis]